MLTGAVPAASDPDDVRRTFPRFQGENLDRNLDAVTGLREVATACGATPAQVALAWLLARGDDVVPIPGTKRRRYLEDNIGALDLTLDDAALARLDALRPVGDRHADMTWVERDTPLLGGTDR
jgi:aryl-alcohol dehydrogenase-like predicted oxidoreductase